jgi:cbb3-type cytochrome oxidase maturation protein
MESLYLLIPLSAVLVLAIIAVFGWALNSGQFEDLDNEGRRILDDTEAVVDPGQGSSLPGSEQSREN